MASTLLARTGPFANSIQSLSTNFPQPLRVASTCSISATYTPLILVFLVRIRHLRGESGRNTTIASIAASIPASNNRSIGDNRSIVAQSGLPATILICKPPPVGNIRVFILINGDAIADTVLPGKEGALLIARSYSRVLLVKSTPSRQNRADGPFGEPGFVC